MKTTRVFVKAGEEYFYNYWANYKKIEVFKNGKLKKLTTFEEYLNYRGLSPELNNPKATRRKAK